MCLSVGPAGNVKYYVNKWKREWVMYGLSSLENHLEPSRCIVIGAWDCSTRHHAAVAVAVAAALVGHFGSEWPPAFAASIEIVIQIKTLVVFVVAAAAVAAVAAAMPQSKNHGHVLVWLGCFGAVAVVAAALGLGQGPWRKLGMVEQQKEVAAAAVAAAAGVPAPE